MRRADRLFQIIQILRRSSRPKTAAAIADDAVRCTWECRQDQQALTGEWIIYLRRQDKNYYLCPNTHGAGDQFIYDRIVLHCARDFPDLPN